MFVPAAVTIPEDEPIVAIVVPFILHAPPVDASVSVVDGELEIQMFVFPVMGATVGNGLTVTTSVE